MKRCWYLRIQGTGSMSSHTIQNKSGSNQTRPGSVRVNRISANESPLPRSRQNSQKCRCVRRLRLPGGIDDAVRDRDAGRADVSLTERLGLVEHVLDLASAVEPDERRSDELVAGEDPQIVRVGEAPEFGGRPSEEPRDLDVAIPELGQILEGARQVLLGRGAQREQLDADPVARHQALGGGRRNGRCHKPRAQGHRRRSSERHELSAIHSVLTVHRVLPC